MSADTLSQLTPLKLTPAEKHLLLVLSLVLASGQSAPSVPELEGFTGLSRSGVLESLASLERQGFIARHREAGKRTRYAVHLATRPVSNPSAGRTRPARKPVTKATVPTSGRVH
jgi:DNA-binding MarR family transcriptional regulator